MRELGAAMDNETVSDTRVWSGVETGGSRLSTSAGGEGSMVGECAAFVRKCDVASDVRALRTFSR